MGTLTASTAPLTKKQYFRVKVPRLRIRTPFAAQWATLEKNSTSDPFSIINRPTLYLKYISAK
jgi:hypothetical protein